MKRERIKHEITQGLLFSTGILVIFIFLLFYYFYPNYLAIEEKKEKLNQLQLENKNLSVKWLGFSEFKTLFLKNNLDSNLAIHIKNDPSYFQETYSSNLINNWTGSFNDFITNVENRVKSKELDLKNTNIKEKINKILPYYKKNSALEWSWLTDFIFINYIEKIMYNFWLEVDWNIGIWTLNLELKDPKKLKIKEKKVNNNNQLEWEIYSFKLPLTLTWNKKSIIDFVYYLENVWNISFTKDGEDVEIKKFIVKKSYIDEEGKIIKNDFYNLPRYFSWKKDIFNNLVVDIENIWFPEYLDSSLTPISYDEWKTFINFIKNTQANEKYEIQITLKFYIKWLEKYKINKYIKNVYLEYEKISKFLFSSIKVWKNDKLNSSASKRYSLKELEKNYKYLLLIWKDIKKLSNTKLIDKNIWNSYIEAKKYKEIIDTILKSTEPHILNISEDIYKKIKND